MHDSIEVVETTDDADLRLIAALLSMSHDKPTTTICTVSAANLKFSLSI